MRTIIAGGPRCGKTTLAERMEREGSTTVRHLDDLIATHDWSAASEAASRFFDEPGPWVIEGVQAARALRKWLARSAGKPCDRLVLLMEPHKTLSRGQASMLKGVETVMREIARELRGRGVRIE
jgi:broad-specificity NMP kinase